MPHSLLCLQAKMGLGTHVLSLQRYLLIDELSDRSRDLGVDGSGCSVWLWFTGGAAASRDRFSRALS